MSSPAAPTTTASTFASLHLDVFASVIAPLLKVNDLISAASTSKACRQLVLSPPVWRHRDFVQASPLNPPSSASLPSWCDVVQRLHMEGPRDHCTDWPLLFPSLHLFPNLCCLSIIDVREGRQPYPFPSVTSLASLRYLTQVSLWWSGQLAIGDLKLLSTLPALASFTVEVTSFETGSEETLREWLAVSAQKRGKKRKAQEVEEVAEEEKVPLIGLHQPQRREEPTDPSLPQRHSPLLLFLHALAAKPSFVHLQVKQCNLTPFVCDHMPVWPHLLCLSVEDNEELSDYSFDNAAVLFPSLTSFTSPNCSGEAIGRLLAIPKLEELRFGGDSALPITPEDVQKAVGGLRVLGTAASLHSVLYICPDLIHDEILHETAPAVLAALASVFSLTFLTRLTVPAYWLREREAVQLFAQHHFPHLRCLELQVLIDGYAKFYVCPQTDAALLPLVKPASMVVSGRAERQAARAKKHEPIREVGHPSGEGRHAVTGYVSRSRESMEAVIPANNAANFPALECLALPYRKFHAAGEGRRGVSVWMKQQLRRSYEYERVRDWEAEMVTLGEAELLKDAGVVRAW